MTGLHKVKTRSMSHLDGVVGVGDDCDEKAEDHVDEERHEGVEVNPAEDPHHAALVLHVLEGGKHVVPVDQGEQTLRHRVQGAELRQREEGIFHFSAKGSVPQFTPQNNLRMYSKKGEICRKTCPRRCKPSRDMVLARSSRRSSSLSK